MKRLSISISILLILTSINIIGCGSNTEKNKDGIKKDQEVNQNKEKVEKTNNIQRENVIGTSDKNFKDITTAKPMKVNKDVAGNFRVTTVATTENILEYAKSYYENNFTNDGEIHMIVNFTLNTTTTISRVFDMISVTIKERIDKEEHDAKVLGSGQVLGEYFIYLDNGDIEKVN